MAATAAIQTVLCPVDFSAATGRQLAVAADLCRLFGARLVVHHNLEEMPPGAAVGWMYAAEHRGVPSESDDEERMRKLLDEVPVGIDKEARITHGLPASAVLEVGARVGADLLVLVTHNDGPEAHTSVTEEVIERADCVVLALHEPSLDVESSALAGLGGGPHAVLVPTDFSPESTPAVRFAFELARRLSLELHLLHVVEGHARAESEAEARRRLAALVPEELAGRVRVEVAAGDPAREIAAAAERLDAASIVMGEHTRAPFRRWMTRDTSRALLHRALCPVWYVPAKLA
jgi:nucleotide-binding universal stress UspA family protein